MKLRQILSIAILTVAAFALSGCKGITKSFLGSEGGDSGVISIDSTSVYGKHTLRSANPLPGYSVLIHPDGTMEMRWVGTNAPPPPISPLLNSLRGPPVPQKWLMPLIVDPYSQPIPSNSGP